MKRWLSITLCALLMLGLLPLAAAPARMITEASVYASPSSAYVGDQLNWWVQNVFGVGPYSYSWDIYRGYSLYKYDSTYHEGLWDYYWYAPEAGSFRVKAWVFDAGTGNAITRLSSFIPVYLRPSPVVYQVSSNGTSGNSLYVDWNDIYGADGYEVWRGFSRLGAYTLVATTTNSYFYSYGLTPGTQYFFKIRTFNWIGGVRRVSGSFSGAYAGIPIGKPTVYSLYPTGRERVFMSWSYVPGATGYQIFLGTSPYYMNAVRTTAATSMTVTGLTTGRNFYLAVKAYRRIAPNTYYGPQSDYRFVQTLR